MPKHRAGLGGNDRKRLKSGQEQPTQQQPPHDQQQQQRQATKGNGKGQSKAKGKSFQGACANPLPGDGAGMEVHTEWPFWPQFHKRGPVWFNFWGNVLEVCRICDLVIHIDSSSGPDAPNIMPRSLYSNPQWAPRLSR